MKIHSGGLELLKKIGEYWRGATATWMRHKDNTLRDKGGWASLLGDRGAAGREVQSGYSG